LINGFLTQQGARVIAAGVVFKGLRAIRKRHPDIVLSDTLMPGRDAFELLRDVQALEWEAGGNVPVFATSAFSQTSVEMLGLQ
jgi:DNA-binding response OmpR family regulator